MRSALLGCVSVAAACSTPVERPLPDVVAVEEDVGEPAELQFGLLEAAPAPAMPMVIEVRWTTSVAATSWITYGSGRSCDTWATRPDAPELLHHASLIGPSEGSMVCFRLVADIEGETTTGAAHWIEAGMAPADLPRPIVHVSEPADYDESWFVGVDMSSYSAWIIDRAGQYVWAFANEPDSGMTNAVRRSPGVVTVTRWALTPGRDDDALVHVDDLGVELEQVMLPGMHHAAIVLPDGRVAYLMSDLREVAGFGAVVGDELRVVGSDGSWVTVWNTFDDWDRCPLVVDDDNLTFYPEGVDWSHADSIAYDPVRDSFVIAVRTWNTVVEVGWDGTWLRSVGECGEYTVGGQPDGSFIGAPYNAVLTDDGNVLLVVTPKSGRETLAVELRPDDANHQFEVVWRYGDGLALYAPFEGNAERLANGNTLVNFGTVTHEVTADGRLVWELAWPVVGPDTPNVSPGYAAQIHAIADLVN